MVLLAEIIPCKEEAGCDQFPQINDVNIPMVAQTDDSPQSRVFLVDQYSGFDPTTLLHDLYHPNDTGEQFMARQWFNAIVGQVLALVSRLR
jgi:hypothetical protein